MENKCKEDCVCKIEGKTHSFNDGCGCPMHNGEEFDTSPKEECKLIINHCKYCGWTTTVSNLKACHRCGVDFEPFSSPKEEGEPIYSKDNDGIIHMEKEEIVNDWESELKKLLDDPRTGLKDSSDTNKTRYAILELFSSTKKRVAKEIIGEIKRYSYETKVDGRFMKLTEIINLIKSKYK